MKALRTFSIVRQVASEDGSIKPRSPRTLSQVDAGLVRGERGRRGSNDEEERFAASKFRTHGDQRDDLAGKLLAALCRQLSRAIAQTSSLSHQAPCPN